MSRYFNSSYGRIVYTDQQTGNIPVIFVHGLPTAKELFWPVVPHLSADLRAITFDLNDYGESEKLNQSNSKAIGATITHKQRADVLDELRAHLGLDSFVLVAHDLGASVTVDYMRKYGRYVQKLVLISPPVYPDFVEPSIVKLVRLPHVGELLVRIGKHLLLDLGIKQGLLHKENYSRYFQRALADAFAGRAGEAALLRNLRWGRPSTFFKDYPAILRQVEAPTLILQGQHDPYIPLAHAQRLENDMVNGRLHIIPDGSHFLPLDTPEEVALQINHFISV